MNMNGAANNHQDFNAAAVERAVLNQSVISQGIVERMKLAESARLASAQRSIAAANLAGGLAGGVNAALSEVRWDRVKSLRSSIAAGEYTVSAEHVACKLMLALRA